MYDVTCEQSFLNIREWIQTIGDIADRTLPIIIIGNKTDLRDNAVKNGVRVVSYQEGAKFAQVNILFLKKLCIKFNEFFNLITLFKE